MHGGLCVIFSELVTFLLERALRLVSVSILQEEAYNLNFENEIKSHIKCSAHCTLFRFPCEKRCTAMRDAEERTTCHIKSRKK